MYTLTMTKYNDLLLLLHRSPEVPAGQAQIIVLTTSWHWPPFWQGFGTQDTLSENTQHVV